MVKQKSQRKASPTYYKTYQREFQLLKTVNRHNKKLLNKATPWKEKQFIGANCQAVSSSTVQHPATKAYWVLYG